MQSCPLLPHPYDHLPAWQQCHRQARAAGYNCTILPYSAYKQVFQDSRHNPCLQHCPPVSHILFKIVEGAYLACMVWLGVDFTGCCAMTQRIASMFSLLQKACRPCAEYYQLHGVSDSALQLQIPTPDNSCRASLLQLVRSRLTAATQSCSMLWSGWQK